MLGLLTASRQLAGLPQPLLACPRPASSLLMGFDPKATLGIVDRPQTPLGSWQACLFLWASESDVRHVDRPQTPLGSWQACLSAAGRPVVASLWPVRSLPPLFLWASEGDVRHFGPPSKASRQPAGLLRALCGLSEACSLLSSYGVPKATLGILDRPQTPLGSWQACLFSWPVPGLPLLSYGRPASNVRPFGPPPNPSRQLAGLPLLLACPRPASSLLMGFDPKATLGIVDRPQTPLGSWQACLSLLMGFREQR